MKLFQKFKTSLKKQVNEKKQEIISREQEAILQQFLKKQNFNTGYKQAKSNKSDTE